MFSLILPYYPQLRRVLLLAAAGLRPNGQVTWNMTLTYRDPTLTMPTSMLPLIEPR